jgi:hypothetical protein
MEDELLRESHKEISDQIYRRLREYEAMIQDRDNKLEVRDAEIDDLKSQLRMAISALKQVHADKSEGLQTVEFEAAESLDASLNSPSH